MDYKSFNEKNLLEHFIGDEEILIDLISIVQVELSKLLEVIGQAILTNSADQLRINAHTVKGILSNFYAEEARKLAYELELRGTNSSFNEAVELFNNLEDLLKVFLVELNVLKNKLSYHL